MSVEKVASDQVESVVVPIFACAMAQPNNVAHCDYVNSVPSLSQIVVTRNLARETTTLRRQEDAPELKGPLRPEIARRGEKKV